MISIAIPDSLFIQEDTLRERTIKVGEIARAVAIFGVERIYIYRDAKRSHESDYETAKMILEYMETPQYLRRRLIGRRKELEFVGLLPPLRIPSHRREPSPKVGEIREAVIVMQNGELMADIGSKELAIIEGRVHEGQRATVQVTSTSPLFAKLVPKPENEYWGYEVRKAPTLARFLKSGNFDLVIFTSRTGQPVETVWDEFCKRCSEAHRIVACFGSPEAGVDKMLKQDDAGVSDFKGSLYLNTFPSQNAETIRLEEAVLGFLSIVNIARNL
jgi:methyltransferase